MNPAEAWKAGESLLRIRDVRDRTGLGRTTIYRLMAEDRFPRQVQISENTVGWYRSEIDAWIASRPRFSVPEGAQLGAPAGNGA